MKYLLILFAICVSACNNRETSEVPGTGLSPEKQLIQVLQKYPDSILLVENLAQYYRENGEYEKSLAAVDEALKRDSTVYRLWHIKGILHYENLDTAKAIKALEISARLSSNSDDILRLAKLYAETKNPSALPLADLLLKQGEFIKESILIKGIYYSSIKEDEKALNFFDEAIKTGYTFMEPYKEKALVLYRQEKYMEALRVLDKAVKIKSSYAEGYFYMGLCFEKLNRLEDAKESFETALIYEADYEEATQALAKVNSLLK
jgi:tetratricopeptide (TPR) repeat protein